MKKITIYIPVSVEDRKPTEGDKVSVIKNGKLDWAYWMPASKMFNHHSQGIDFNQKEITHWLEAQEVDADALQMLVPKEKVGIEPELLVGDYNGIYTPQVFCTEFARYITNAEELKEDIDICLKGVDEEHYWDAWDNIVDKVILVNDAGVKVTIGYLEGGDLWGFPEGYEFPSDDDENSEKF